MGNDVALRAARRCARAGPSRPAGGPAGTPAQPTSAPFPTTARPEALLPPNNKLTCPTAIPVSDNDKQASDRKQFTWPGQVQHQFGLFAEESEEKFFCRRSSGVNRTDIALLRGSVMKPFS